MEMLKLGMSQDINKLPTKTAGLHGVFKDETFFDDLSDEHKGYILGLISSDGYIRDIPYHIKFDVNDRDEALIDYVHAVLGGSKSYVTRLVPKKTHETTSVRLCICSKKLVSKLKDLGLSQAKTYTQPSNFDDLPTVESKKGYLRGIFEGDGCIVFTDQNHKYAYIEIVGSWQLITDIAKHVEWERPSFYVLRNHFTKKKKVTSPIPNGQHSVIVKNRQDVKRFYDYIYTGYEYQFCLERKRSRFLEMGLLYD